MFQKLNKNCAPVDKFIGTKKPQKNQSYIFKFTNLNSHF